MLHFHVYDVFTDRPFSGNPLAIVEDAGGLSTGQMQTIAKQFNLSETIFIMPPERGGTAKVRIFLPAAEIPFAGHPTVGCAIHLASRSGAEHIVLEEVAGDVAVTLSPGKPVMAEFTAPLVPSPHPGRIDAALIPAALDLSADDIGPHAPGTHQGGNALLYVPVRNLDALARARPIEPHWSRMLATLAHPDVPAITGGYLYAPHDGGYRARMFAPGNGIPEDPATGSATAHLASQLLGNGALDDGTTVVHLEQGVEMGRPSRLRLTIDVAEQAITAVRVAGSAVPVAEGRIAVPA